MCRLPFRLVTENDGVGPTASIGRKCPANDVGIGWSELHATPSFQLLDFNGFEASYRLSKFSRE